MTTKVIRFLHLQWQIRFPFFALFFGVAGSLGAQGFSAAAPVKEFIWFGGRLIAVRQVGGANGSSSTSVRQSSAASTDPSDPGNTGVVTSAPPPPQPTAPTVPPSDLSNGAPRFSMPTPPESHTATP